MYVDLVGQTEFFDIKNVFGTLTKTKKGFSYSKRKCPQVPYHSDCMQVALYSKELPKDYDKSTYEPDAKVETAKEVFSGQEIPF